MGLLKKMLRKPQKPLEQIVKRYNEICSLKLNNIIKKFEICYSGLHKHGPNFKNIQGYQYTTVVFKKHDNKNTH